ncbi:hemerythrin domain-containing protein [Actibacterium sp. XHP0104]|uniref:hemerythrin domain-containing protein n=1 Tax=Actibacterium sp. XHP0104 TaxID=2984335 RepID=UPI0021E9992C|nr:hemerythrin domain-containing protein [Actibacterium sp. XHP0104]MCV2881564.1 hemerythrin domain-containing protein [Actibacterium sp. XHP0104]
MTRRARRPKGEKSSRSARLRALGDPLDFILRDHHRLREICAEIDRLAEKDHPTADEAEMVLGFLRQELPQLIDDERDDLLPLMLRRCPPEDEIGRLKDRLDWEHDIVQACLPFVVEAFEGVWLYGRALSPDAAASMRAFTGHLRRHLIVENAVLIPLARVRLGRADLDMLSLRMLRRRGLDRLLELPDAD